MERIPKKIALFHIMRTGGTTLTKFLSRKLAPTHWVLNSWAENRERDWTEDELHNFLSLRGNVFVHNHVRGWSKELAHAYLDAGFVLISVVRPIGDQLCSLYFWGQKHTPDVMTCSLDEFLRLQLQGENFAGMDHTHWEIPAWWELIDVIQPLTPDGLRSLLSESLHIPDVEAMIGSRENTSANSGFESAVLSGLISDETITLLTTSVYEQRYQEILRRCRLDR